MYSKQILTAEHGATRVLPRHRVPAHLARRFHQVCLGMGAEILDPEDLNPIEYALLAAVDDNPGIDQRGLSGRLGVDPASTSQMVERLARRGLLEQAVQPTDRRARLLSATPVGTQLRARLRPGLLDGWRGRMIKRRLIVVKPA